MKKLIISFLFIILIFSCSREAAEKLKDRVDDYNISSISALSQVELIYLKILPVDKEGNIDNSLKFEVINHFDKIEAAYISYKDIFEKLESGYFLAAPTVQKSKQILEKLLKQQVYFYKVLDQPDSLYFLQEHIKEGSNSSHCERPSGAWQSIIITDSDIEDRFLDCARNDNTAEENIRVDTQKLLYSAILKGLLVLELVENYNKFDISSINNIISDYKIKLNNPDFNENINFIINKIGGSK